MILSSSCARTGGAPYPAAPQALPLKFVKFQNVRSLTVFIENNQDDEDTTKLSKLVLMGFT